MTKNQMSQICGFMGLILIVTGAVLFAINSPNRDLTGGAFYSGLFLFFIFLLLNINVIREFSKKRALRFGANLIIMVILFICIITIIQALSIRHSKRIDLTRNQRFSLAGQTMNLIETLDKEIKITGYFKRNSPDKSKAEDLIAQYTHKSPWIRYEFIDPDHKPQIAKDAGISAYGTTVVACGTKAEMLDELTEETLTNAVLKVTRDLMKAIYITRGHAERNIEKKELDGISLLKEAIEKENYLIRSISLFEEESIPDNCYLLIIAGPQKDLFESEIAKIEKYLLRGRSAIVMVDPLNSLPNLEGLIARYYLAFENTLIIDQYSRVFGYDYDVPVVSQYANHPITKGFNIATVFPVARSVKLLEKETIDITVEYLAWTGKTTWGETDLKGYRKGKAAGGPEDVQGPVPVVAIATKIITLPDTSGIGRGEEIESKLVIFGDSDLVCNSTLRVSGNADFFMNVINYLAEEEDLISIRPKQSLGDRVFLTASQGRLIFLLCVVLLPLAVISIGTTIHMQKRRKG